MHMVLFNSGPAFKYVTTLALKLKAKEFLKLFMSGDFENSYHTSVLHCFCFQAPVAHGHVVLSSWTSDMKGNGN